MTRCSCKSKEKPASVRGHLRTSVYSRIFYVNPLLQATAKMESISWFGKD
jgi:hypothetical protein